MSLLKLPTQSIVVRGLLNPSCDRQCSFQLSELGCNFPIEVFHFALDGYGDFQTLILFVCVDLAEEKSLGSVVLLYILVTDQGQDNLRSDSLSKFDKQKGQHLCLDNLVQPLELLRCIPQYFHCFDAYQSCRNCNLPLQECMLNNAQNVIEMLSHFQCSKIK